MAESVGTAGGGLPNLNLTPEEKRVYGQLFKEADPDGFGAVSGDVAVRFFEKTRLQPEVLGQIWQIADTENRGFLTPAGFGVVLRLIGHAQAGRTPSVSQATQPAPLPRFEGNIAAMSPQTTGVPSSPTQGGPPIRVPALGPDKAAEYSSLFEKSGAENGMLSGVVAKQIFERAKLPNEVLGRIWGLADTQGRGALDTTEFVIAMHLLTSYKAGAMRGVPNTLPPGLYDAATRRGPPRMGGPYRPGSAGGHPSVLYGQSTGFGPPPPQSPTSRQQTGTPLSNQTTGDWIITPADKARFDQIFTTVDRQGLGYINGDQAVEFFGNARLPEDVLAQIWDLSDINSEGRLDKDEFAVAMYLIRQQRGSKDGRGILPSTLPPALVPPSKRKLPVAPSQPTAPAFENAPVTKPRSAADDLFGLDVLAATQASQSTGGTEVGIFANPSSPVMPPGALPPAAGSAAASLFKPFEPSSSFGRSLGPQQAGSPAPGQSRGIPATITENEDLLGDADPAVSSKLTSETSELGNLSNQVGNLSKQMTELQGNRAQADQELSQTNHQKRAFEGRLAQLRSAYEKEVQEYKTLQEQLTASRNETKRLQQDMAMIEGSHSDLTNQHQQLRAAFEADQRENIALKEKIRQLNTETDQLKPQLEKLKGDARQQKGLVAINKKQLATNEAERDRLRTELDAAQKEMNSATKELEESARQIEVSKADIEKAKDAVPPPPAVRSPPAMPSPSASVSSNPFMRRPGNDATFSPPMGSPEPVPDNRDTFDNLFGPSFTGATTAATVPTTSFRTQTPPAPDIETDRSVTPSVIEPPAPPSSKQLTSDSLPFRTSLQRADSMGSSVQVAPPASRLSPADTPRAVTPATMSSSEEQAQQTQQSIDFARPDEEQESIRSAVEATTPAVDIPGAFPGAETPRSATPSQTSNKAAIAAGAGAATVATGVGLAVVNATNSQDDLHDGVQLNGDTKQASNFDEYFGGPAHQRTPSEQVKDFDAAFASMKAPESQAASKPASQEFPDIQELEDDDDSSDEEAPLGFDDDFSSKAGPSTAAVADDKTTEVEPVSNAAGKQPEVASALPGHLQARPVLDKAPSTASSLPDIEREVSPPTYNDSVPEDNPSHFPREYKGLLPEREDPTSPPASGTTQAAPPPAGSPPLYGPEVTKSQSEALNNVISSQSALPPPTQSAAFDFDSAFSGVGPAQVEDDDSDDADATFGTNRGQVSEFDPTFDSPAQSRAATVASTADSPAVHHSVTNGNTSTTQQPSATEAFYNFGGAATTKEASEQKTNNAPISHDWDSLFAPLGNSTAPVESEVDVPNPPPSSLKPERPQPGRALSTGTEHDDPILKRLTSMGWSRAESLAALEKFDYNIDKAADHLTFRS